jgi:hypothetical protein
MDSYLPKDIRYLAIIQLKNGIDKYWRKTATKYDREMSSGGDYTLTHLSAIDKADKALIRARLLESGINEANQQLALQNALVVAKVARFEYPNDWYIPQSYYGDTCSSDMSLGQMSL